MSEERTSKIRGLRPPSSIRHRNSGLRLLSFFIFFPSFVLRYPTSVFRCRSSVLVFLFVCTFFLAGCPARPPEAPQRQALESPVLKRVPADRLPDLPDDEPAETLRSAIMTSLAWYGRISDDKPIPFGDHTISAGALKDSLKLFLDLLDSGHIDPRTLSQEFDIFQVVPPDGGGRMLVTGYYEPVLEGSLKPGGQFKWPLYGIPPDLVTVELDRFDPVRFHGERLVGRLEKNRLVPFYTRSEIEGKGKLERSGVELVWLKDPVDSFFLHIQGSGMIKLPDGRFFARGLRRFERKAVPQYRENAHRKGRDSPRGDVIAVNQGLPGRSSGGSGRNNVGKRELCFFQDCSRRSAGQP